MMMEAGFHLSNIFAHLMEIIYGYYFIEGHKSATLLEKVDGLLEIVVGII